MKDWLVKMFNSIDQMDADRFVSFLAEEASFKFATAPAVKGRKNIHDSVSQFFSAISDLHHDVKEVWEFTDVVICEGEVTYTRHDALKMSFPFVDILRMKDGLIVDYRIYTDNSSLFA